MAEKADSADKATAIFSQTTGHDDNEHIYQNDSIDLADEKRVRWKIDMVVLPMVRYTIKRTKTFLTCADVSGVFHTVSGQAVSIIRLRIRPTHRP